MLAAYNRIQRGFVLNTTIMTMQTRRATCVQSDNGVLAAYSRIQRDCVLNAILRKRERERDPTVDINSKVESL